MNNIGQMMKQAQQLQEKIQKVQKQIEEHSEQGSGGAGMIKITLSGKNDIKELKIDPAIVNPNEIAMLEDLIIAAYNDARNKIESYSNEQMSKVSGGLPGGLKLPF